MIALVGAEIADRTLNSNAKMFESERWWQTWCNSDIVVQEPINATPKSHVDDPFTWRNLKISLLFNTVALPTSTTIASVTAEQDLRES
jgi:hypothetical protein